jgi:hypothetical protein
LSTTSIRRKKKDKKIVEREKKEQFASARETKLERVKV